MNEAVHIAPAGDPRRRAYWLKTLHQWHWISAAVSLVAIVLFSATGLTLNHARSIEAQPSVVTQTATIPAPLAAALADTESRSGRAMVPQALAQWLREQWSIEASGIEAQWTDGEIYFTLPRPGGDAWVSVAIDTGAATWERTDRGWIAWFNDLHKGRNTGAAWGWFIDVFAIASLVFSLTGVALLWMHRRQRAMTWPLLGLGLALPLLLLLLFIH